MKKNRNLNGLASIIENNSSSKENINSMLGEIRGGAQGGSVAHSSSYTSGTRDCDNTSICKICIPDIKL